MQSYTSSSVLLLNIFIEMRLSRHQLWSGSSYDGAACRPRRCPVQVVPSDQPQLCGSVKLVPMADLSALPSCSTSPWRQTLERPRKNSHHARSTRTPTHSSPAGPLLVQFPVLKVLDFPKGAFSSDLRISRSLFSSSLLVRPQSLILSSIRSAK